jgi:hypothetical protein
MSGVTRAGLDAVLSALWENVAEARAARLERALRETVLA